MVEAKWQWRSRVKGGAWDAWEQGRFGQEIPPFMEVEERTVPASPAPALPESGVEAALARLCDAVMADISEAKRRLDADIPKDAPVHPVSAFLTGLAIHVGKARAALTQKDKTL